MHGSYIDAMGMKVEHQYALPHDHDRAYRPGQLVHVAADHSPHTSPPHGYGAFDFTSPTETMYSRTFPPAHFAAQPLHPLHINTTTLWPSQITNPSENPGLSHPALPIHRPIAPVTRGAPVAIASQSSAGNSTPALPTPRKTLSDDDRRRMCKFNEENPSVKQTEIGARFGVERSTVSKVLRQKEKYLVPEESKHSPVKKTKSKIPDVERTLSRWVRNRISENLPVDDNIIRDEARKFASTLGSAESHNQVNDPTWLESFKQRNQIPTAEPSPVKIERSSLSPSSKSGSKTPNAKSPVIGWDGKPVNPVKDELKTKSPDSFYDTASAWGHTHSQSSVSLGSCFSDDTIASPSYTGDFRSPTSPYFSPMSSCGPSPAMPAQKTARKPLSKIIPAPAAALRRRQTVPLIGTESPDSATPKRRPPSSLDSPPVEMDISPLGIDSAAPISRPGTTIPTPSTINQSPLSMAPPSTGLDGSASSPSQDEARAALETLMTFIHHQPNGVVDPHDYLVMGKWMQMLKLETGSLPGGMQLIPMSERADGTVPIGRKRSEHSLS